MESAQTTQLLQHCDLQSPQAHAVPLTLAPRVVLCLARPSTVPKRDPKVEITVIDAPTLGEVTTQGFR